MEKGRAKQDMDYTKYERARILGARALQISANAPILLKLSKDELESLNYDPIKIAELEFNAGILPITVKRPFPKFVERNNIHFKEIVKEEEKPDEKPKKAAEEIKSAEELETEIETEFKEDLTEEEVVEEKPEEE